MKKLTVLTSFLVCIPIAYAGEWISDGDTKCQIWNPSPSPGESIKWSGECLDGKASGKGILQWFKGGVPNGKYVGEYQFGKKNGRGIYSAISGSGLDVEYADDEPNGFGRRWYVKGQKIIESFGKNGEPEGSWVGDKYVLHGLFERGAFVLSCASKAVCEKLKRLEDQRKAEEEQYRIAHACDRFYSGKAIGFKPAGLIYFGAVLDAVVVGSGGGNVSIKISDRNFDSYGKTLEVPCTSDQLK